MSALLSAYRRRGGAAPAWAPSDISGLQLWYDAADNGTLFQNSGGTGAVTADGDPVGYWGDKSGNTRNVIQATPGRRPLYKPNGIDTGKPSLLCDDIDDFLSRTGFTLTGVQTVALVYRLQSTPSAAELDSALTYSDGTTTGWVLICGSGSYQPISWRLNATTSAAGVGIADAHTTGKRRLVIRYDGGTSTLPASYDALFDGVSKTVVASGAVGVNPTQVTVGARADAALPSSLNLAEVIVYNSRLSDGDRTLLETYLAAKW